jgi:hypothetical protein
MLDRFLYFTEEKTFNVRYTVILFQEEIKSCPTKMERLVGKWLLKK